MTSYIIDASVAIKWVLDEQYKTEASRYMQCNASIYAPDLIKQECANAIIKKIHIGDLTSEQGWELYEQLFQLNTISVIPTDQFMDTAFNYAILLNHSIYDCLYLAAAMQFNSTVVTADSKFYKKTINHENFSSHIRWVAEMPFR